MLERLGIPSVHAAAEGFVGDAKNSAGVNGMPTLRVVEIKGYTWMGQTAEQKKPLAEASVNDLADALTRPLTPTEITPPPAVAEKYPPAVVTGKSYESAIEAFNQKFFDMKLGDGLGLIPPTREAVDWMLSGTSRSPSEELGKMAPNWGKATIENVAVNAVMAGAKPEYLPVIIAAVEGMTDPNIDIIHEQVSAGCFNIAIIVSGPIGGEIKMNYDIGVLGYGNRAGNSIARAIQLCEINLGHKWPGQVDLCQQGRENFFPWCFSERPDSPWKPYHVAAGFGPAGSSAVSLQVAGSGPTGFGGVGPTYQGESSLAAVLTAVASGRSQLKGLANERILFEKKIVVFNPASALGLRDAGWDQAKLQEYFFEKSKVPYEELTAQEIDAIKKRIQVSKDLSTVWRLGFYIPAKMIPLWEANLKPGGRIPVIALPEDIHIFCSGGMPGTNFYFSYNRAHDRITTGQTRLIRGATLTQSGR